MAEEIKDLIAKIQQEGIRAAEDNAAKIKKEADTLAQKIIADAKAEAKKIIAEANIEAKRLDDSTRASLKQAGRDFLISLRKEINSTLDAIIKANIRQALSTEELSGIIISLIKNASFSSGAEVIISLSQQDKEKLEKEFLSQLIQESKKQVTLKSSDSIYGGFTISFDSGKSIFDFTTPALAEYISTNLRPELIKILQSQ
ncbi:MAG: V-type ATP synthase subunit E family protein [Candidatus Omnitrophota bacterium]